MSRYSSFVVRLITIRFAILVELSLIYRQTLSFVKLRINSGAQGNILQNDLSS
jgi:hypothetical protein